VKYHLISGQQIAEIAIPYNLLSVMRTQAVTEVMCVNVNVLRKHSGNFIS